MPILVTIGFAILMACIVYVAITLNNRINALDEEIFRYMKEEHNARVETEPICENCEHYGHKVNRCLLNKCKYTADTDCGWK